MSEKNYVELPIIPLEHAEFVRCAESFGMTVVIREGVYFVEYDNISDLFLLGRQVERTTAYINPLSDNCKLSINKK